MAPSKISTKPCVYVPTGNAAADFRFACELERLTGIKPVAHSTLQTCELLPSAHGKELAPLACRPSRKEDNVIWRERALQRKQGHAEFDERPAQETVIKVNEDESCALSEVNDDCSSLFEDADDGSEEDEPVPAPASAPGPGPGPGPAPRPVIVWETTALDPSVFTGLPRSLAAACYVPVSKVTIYEDVDQKTSTPVPAALPPKEIAREGEKSQGVDIQIVEERRRMANEKRIAYLTEQEERKQEATKREKERVAKEAADIKERLMQERAAARRRKELREREHREKQKTATGAAIKQNGSAQEHTKARRKEELRQKLNREYGDVPISAEPFDNGVPSSRLPAPVPSSRPKSQPKDEIKAAAVAAKVPRHKREEGESKDKAAAVSASKRKREQEDESSDVAARKRKREENNRGGEKDAATTIPAPKRKRDSHKKWPSPDEIRAAIPDQGIHIMEFANLFGFVGDNKRTVSFLQSIGKLVTMRERKLYRK